MEKQQRMKKRKGKSPRRCRVNMIVCVSITTPHQCASYRLTNDAVAESWLVRGYRDARGDGTFRTATATNNLHFLVYHPPLPASTRFLFSRRKREKGKEHGEDSR
ncbi:uncharacterized protein LOC105252032 isoform X2 [Camponotus floridanus]|uniref:uncharacterized protein LOC105252032 isoform X2 n=1 Tax=Camponotus floridanus TaxID=104421 RepID=UPI000DC69B3F|nr:uncharacterized protein LOC105252032 isoform X2 [Camponotus floridanus]